MQRKLLATAAAASTLGGAVAGAALLGPAFAGAQEDTDPATTTEAPDATETAEADRPEFGEGIAAALQGLVDDGTLTQAQLDAVVETLDAARDELGPRHGPGARFARGLGGGADLAEILGLDQDALREEIAAGNSLADIAAEQGVDTQDLVDAIVTATEERVSGAVENGRLDQERADEIVAGAAEKAEELVNGEFEFEGRGRGFRDGFGPHRDRGSDGTDSDSADSDSADSDSADSDSADPDA